MESVERMMDVLEDIAKSDEDPGFAERLPSTSEIKLIRGAHIILIAIV